MADYGHDLIFGAFLSPQNAEPQAPVALARLSEREGLDLVTFQDHPYQPAFLDAWTLLSYVAASTERIKISGNVINLPLRPPVLLARQAASLDLLSGGRFELGLGAGAFWDAIEAMGGPRRSPAEAVASLSEAIDLIRATWDAGRRGGIFADGEQYRIRGAKRGPAPAHDVSIWLGVLGPRMLRLAGEKADGWLPSLGYLKPGDLERGNAIIDEAAAAAGRDPRDIRRLLNITPEAATVDDLLPFVLRDGVSAFILASDDPRAIQAWGEEVAPALREAVARERAAAGTESGDVVRGPKALALRRDGIAYHALPAALRATAFELDAYPVSDVVFAQMLYDATDATGLLERWGKLVEAAPRQLTSFLYLSPGRGSSTPVAQALTVWSDEDTDAAVGALTPLLSVAPVLRQQAQLLPYAAIVAPHDATHYGGQADPLFSNGFAVHLTAELNEGIAAGLRGAATPFVAIRAVGGAVNDVDPDATAYPHRHQNFNVSSVGADAGRFRAYWDELRPHLDGLYLSFETDQRPQRLRDAFPGTTLTRLRELKAVYDPQNVFNQNFPIDSIS